ncbi:hypothetical protein [Chromobacterium subtsugae]|uniref:hypothetical protein n=1 Tax=Chromobacterium subtsugae TaxID=251747 RepID=UPI000A8B1939|nr:hypothetical protein [Chromobacterium subtsugae]
MINEETIKEHLGQFVDIITEIRVDEQNKIILLDLFDNNVSNKREHNSISPGQIEFLKRKLRKLFDFRVEVVLKQSELSTQIEEDIRYEVKKKYPNLVESVSLSFKTSTDAYVIVFPAAQLSKDACEDIERHIKAQLELVEVKSVGFDFVLNKWLEPSNIQILRLVKITAPVTLDNLMARINGQNLYCPSERWLASKLDLLRKKRLVVRLENGTYALSARGLLVTPYGTDRKSSDVERMLFLGKVHV